MDNKAIAKASGMTGLSIGTVIAGWLFIDSYLGKYALAADVERENAHYSETLTYIQLDISEDKLLRLQSQVVTEPAKIAEKYATEKKLERRIRRLEKQLDKGDE